MFVCAAQNIAAASGKGGTVDNIIQVIMFRGHH